MTTPVRDGAPLPAAITTGRRQATGELGALTGMRLGDYELRDMLGVGGMAEVYRAFDPGLERDVAVKVLSGPLASDVGYVRRFRDEARRVAALSHPHIVPIYAFGEEPERGLLYLVMPVVPGSMRDHLMRVGRLPADQAVELVYQVASALEAAHAAGFVHRDVKPENILLDAQGSALLTDFGIAREVTVLRQAGTMRTLSATGLPVGTPEYMAPEQLRGESADQRVDVYALGAVLYELLTGSVPHEAPTPYEVAALALMAPLTPPSARNPEIGRALEQVVMRALARGPGDRYPDVQHFVAALHRAMAAPSGSGTLNGSAGMADDKGEDTTPVPTVRAPGAAAAKASTSEALLGSGGLAAQQDASVAPPAIEDNAIASWPAVPHGRIWPLPKMADKAAPRQSRLLLTAAAAIVLLGLTTGTFALIHGATSTGHSTGSVQAKSTTTATHTRPTVTPTATRVPAPATALALSSTTLILSQSRDGDVCSVTQRITNMTGNTVGWSWKSPAISGFHFVLNDRKLDSWPRDKDPGIAPGDTDTLQILSDCGSHHRAVTVRMVDTLGTSYTLTLQVVPYRTTPMVSIAWHHS
ncbi:MAG: serine/threonine-protein kinase [Ktedonobacterales bacterium]